MSPHSPTYRWFLVSAWAFVLAVTIFDIRWAVLYSSTMSIWESNPIMLWVMMHFGIWSAAIVRLGTVLFAACLMPIAAGRSQLTATITVLSVHVYLAVTYARIYSTAQLQIS